jgi:hypothetical protein
MHRIYQTKFEDGRYYRGKHTCGNACNSPCTYYGSGNRVKELVSQGLEYQTEWMAEFDTSLEAFEAERLFIGTLWSTDILCINEIPGGSGGWDQINERNRKHGIPQSMRDKLSKANSGSNNPNYGNRKADGTISEERCNNIKTGLANRPEEVKELQRKRLSEARTGMIRTAYLIDGKGYRSIDEAEKDLGISSRTIYRRIANNREKFQHYIAYDVSARIEE